MPLAPGTKLGPYEIVAPLGAGGMGEVYRAGDSRLGREVAIKVSAAQFSERFEREARAVAALNRANICTLFDVAPPPPLARSSRPSPCASTGNPPRSREGFTAVPFRISPGLLIS